MGDPERGRPPGARRSSLTRQPPQRTGTWSKRRPRRDCVSPFGPEGSPVDGEHGIPDNPNGPTPNGVEQICIPRPRSRGSNPPPAASRPPPPAGDTRRGGHPPPGMNGNVFQAPSLRDYVSPFGPDGQPQGAAPTGDADGQSRMRRQCAPIPAASKGRPRIARGKSRGTRDAAPGNAPLIASALKGQHEQKG